MTNPTDLKQPVTLKQFSVGRPLGTNDNGSVTIVEADVIPNTVSADLIPADKVVLKRFEHLKGKPNPLLDHDIVARKFLGKDVAEVYHVFSDDSATYVVMEHVVGACLGNYMPHIDISTREKLCLEMALHIFNFVQGLHKVGYNDNIITMENIVMVDRSKENLPSEIRFEEQAFSCLTSDRSSLQSLQSRIFPALSYASPEKVYNKTFDREKADVWSVGVILYQLFSRKSLFQTCCTERTKELIMKKPITFEGNDWEGVCAESKNFLIKILDRNPATRPSVAEALHLAKNALSKSFAKKN